MLKKVRVVRNVLGGCVLAAALAVGQATALEPEHEIRRQIGRASCRERVCSTV